MKQLNFLRIAMAAMIFSGPATGTATNAASFSEREENAVNEISKGAFLIELHLDNEVGSFRNIRNLLEVQNGSYAGVKRMHSSGPLRNRSWYVWINPTDGDAAITVLLAHGNRLGETGSITLNRPQPEPVEERTAQEIVAETLQRHFENTEIVFHEEEPVTQNSEIIIGEPVIEFHDADEDLVALQSNAEIDGITQFGPWLADRMDETWFWPTNKDVGTDQDWDGGDGKIKVDPNRRIISAHCYINANEGCHEADLMTHFDPRYQSNFEKGTEPFWGATFRGNVYGAGQQMVPRGTIPVHEGGSSTNPCLENCSSYVGDPILVTGTVNIRFIGTTTGVSLGEVSSNPPTGCCTTAWYSETGNNMGERQFTATFGGDVATWIENLSGDSVHWIMNKGSATDFDGTYEVYAPDKEHIGFDATSRWPQGIHRNMTSMRGHFYDDGSTYAGEVMGGTESRTFIDGNGDPYQAPGVFVGVFNASRETP